MKMNAPPQLDLELDDVARFVGYMFLALLAARATLAVVEWVADSGAPTELERDVAGGRCAPERRPARRQSEPPTFVPHVPRESGDA